MSATTGSVPQASSTGIQAGALSETSPKTTEKAEMEQLRRSLAYEFCSDVIESECVRRELVGDEGALDEEWFELPDLEGEVDLPDAVRYLDSMGLLVRHPQHANLVQVLDEDAAAPEQCEGGCGPATTVDEDGVPLCDACAKMLADESTEAHAAAVTELMEAAGALASMHLLAHQAGGVICGGCARGAVAGEITHAKECVVGRVAGAVAVLEEMRGEAPGVAGAEFQPIEALYRRVVAEEDRARKATGGAGDPVEVPEDDLASPMPERAAVCGGMRPRTGWESDARPVLTCDQPIGHEVDAPELRHWNREHGEFWPTTAQREAQAARESDAATGARGQ